MTELKQRLALFGRNGIIINGTGDSPEKIKKIKDRLDQIGYESSMIMVNTRDEVSSARNVERGQRGGRTVPEDIRKSKWQDVQNARPELAKLFGDNYNEIDNSEDLRKADPQVRASKEKEFIELYKNINKFIAKPPKNDVSKEWIASELQKKDTAPIPKGESSIEPHPDSGAAQQAKEMGLQYYGFGRYGKNGKVTHRSIHDKLTDVSQTIRTTVKEDVISEAVTFSITGDTPEEVNALFTKMFNSEKQKEQNENTSFSNSNAINMLTLGKKYSVEENRTDSVTLTNADIENILENKKDTYLKDENDKIRVFMLRASAAKESHHINGLVVPNKVTKQGGYIIKINEENQNVSIHQEPVFIKEDGTDNTNQSFRGKITLSEIRSRSFSKNNNRTGLISEETGRSDESGGYEDKQTPAAKSLNWRERKSTTGFEELRAKQKQKLQKESIDKGIETGLSMAGAGESIGRDMGEKIRKKEIKPTVVEMQGDETTASIGAQKEDELKKVGINLQSFKAKRPIG
jgi:predicted 3-demethylubiquinone-9 3-methyltransferase (glyoxalase superfamily)